MPGEESQAVSTRDVPHPHRSVAGASENVEVVGVEGHAIDVIIMANVDTKRLDMIGRPQSSGAIIRACQEVMPKRSPL